MDADAGAVVASPIRVHPLSHSLIRKGATRPVSLDGWPRLAPPAQMARRRETPYAGSDDGCDKGKPDPPTRRDPDER